MKKSNLIMKSLLVMGALFLASCNNDDGFTCPDPLVGELNATESEFSGTWVFTAMVAEDAIDLTKDDTDNPSTDLFAQQKACDRDLVYDFKDNRDYTLKQGYTAEDCTNKQSLIGTWSLSAEKTLTFVANCSSQTTRIETNETGDTFTFATTLSFQDVNGAVITTKVTYSYEKVLEDVNPV